MSDKNPLVFKLASQIGEFEQIHALNYATFVEEIPQHSPNKARKLIDKFHDENSYLICVQGREVLGMVALRDRRPLSLDYKLGRVEDYLPPFERILEYRLLAVKKGHRNSAVFSGIMKHAYEIAIESGYDIAVISGTLGQAHLYRHLGFKPFGPVVGEHGARFQPMYIDIAAARNLKQRSPVLNKNA